MRREDGYVLVLVALLLLPLIGFTGFAVDLGVWYARAAKIQRASDAAALASVQDLPNITKAVATAQSVAAQNGFTDGVNGITVTAVQVPDPTAKMSVTITDANASQYFTKMFRNAVTVARTGTAQFLKPVSMGSPKNFLGTGNLQMQTTGTAAQRAFRENYWLAASGPCASKENGDRILTLTDGDWPGGSFDNCSGQANVEYDSNGYYYAISFLQPSTQSVDVQIYDAAYCSSTLDGLGNSFTTTFTMRDNSSFDPRSTNVLTTWQPQSGDSPIDPCGNWVTLYTIPSGATGTFFVQVQSSGDTNYNGSNAFALRAQVGASWAACSTDLTEPSGGTDGASCPQVYGYGNMGVYASLAGSAAVFYLAQIGPDYNNKQMDLQLWDPGEGARAMQVLDPNNNPVDFQWQIQCYNGISPGTPNCADGSATPTGGWRGSSGTVSWGSGAGFKSVPKAIDLCGKNADSGGGGTYCNNNPQPFSGRLSGAKYNDRLVMLTVQLPADINAAFGGRQWYKIKYYTGSNPTDRTTWSVTIGGAPVRLIPNP